MQLSLFDDVFADPVDELSEAVLNRGSGFENGKKRIAQYVSTNPTIPKLAEYLKNEYGTGGMGSPNRAPNTIHREQHDAKGIWFRGTDSEGNEVEGSLTWKQAAEIVFRLIQRGEYPQ